MAFTFAEKMQENNNALVVDGLNLAFRWKHTRKYNTFRYEFERTIDSIANSYNCHKIIVAADQGSSSYRKNIYPEYKADRKEKYKDQTEEEKLQHEEFFDEFAKALELCEASKVVLRYPGVEADDIAAHICKNHEGYGLDYIWLLSSDRDWSLLVNYYISQFSWRTRKEITLQNWDEHYEVPIDDYISMKCLQGDKGDNIPGIPGIGPKRAADLISKYGSALDIYDMLPIESKYKYIQNLNENGEQILINYELMDLLTYCDDALGEENIANIRERIYNAWP